MDVELAGSGLALADGDLSGAEALLSQAAAQADRLADFLFLPFGTTLAIRLALARGDTGSAMVHGDKLLAAVGDGEVWAPFARALPVLAQAMVAAGRTGAAQALVRRWSDQLTQRDAPLSAAVVPHARAILAAGDRQWSAAARRFRQAADRYAALQSPYESAQANEQAARCLFEIEDSAAVTVLVDAIATYQRLGATWDLDRARSLARQHGVPVPNRHRGGRRGYGNRLSPREQEVAELAALGCTNKEIADELFLSPHTVDKHVRNALRKLGLRSRVALAHRLGTVRPDRAKNGGFSP